MKKYYVNATACLTVIIPYDDDELVPYNPEL
jgi:hypothetical protein